MDSVAEEWRAIPGYLGYEASNLGRIRSLDRIVISIRKYGPVELRWKGRVLKNTPCHGYFTVCIDGNKRSFGVHRLVALAFIGDAPAGMQVDHLNGNKIDNRPENLEYVTPIENVRRAIAMGLLCRQGGRKGKGRFSPDNVREIRRIYSIEDRAEIAKRFDVTASHIEKIAKRRAYWYVPDVDEAASL